MARPERIRKIHVLALRDVTVGPEPTIHTISHEKSSTTMVRMAVAASESVFRMPHLARIAVSPANSAEANAKITHIIKPLLSHLKDTNRPQKCRCGSCLHILTLNVGSVYPKRRFLAVRCRVTWG